MISRGKNPSSQGVSNHDGTEVCTEKEKDGLPWTSGGIFLIAMTYKIPDSKTKGGRLKSS